MTQATASHLPEQNSAEACAECARLRGCGECFEELVRRFQAPLLHYLLRRVRSRHDAEDLVQETFLLAYRKIGSYRASWRFSTWLFTIAHRLAISNWRSQRPSKEASGAGRTGNSDPLTEVSNNELRSKLWDTARDILEPDAFAALWLRYVESMPADQIGLVIDRNANAVRILLHRARAQLGAHLGRAGDFSGAMS